MDSSRIQLDQRRPHHRIQTVQPNCWYHTTEPISQMPNYRCWGVRMFCEMWGQPRCTQSSNLLTERKAQTFMEGMTITKGDKVQTRLSRYPLGYHIKPLVTSILSTAELRMSQRLGSDLTSSRQKGNQMEQINTVTQTENVLVHQNLFLWFYIPPSSTPHQVQWHVNDRSGQTMRHKVRVRLWTLCPG